MDQRRLDRKENSILKAPEKRWTQCIQRKSGLLYSEGGGGNRRSHTPKVSILVYFMGSELQAITFFFPGAGWLFAS